MALSRIQISWFEPPLRLVHDTLKAAVENKVEPSILLSHKLIWQKVKRLLICHLQRKYRPLIDLLTQKNYSISIIAHVDTYYVFPHNA